MFNNNNRDTSIKAPSAVLLVNFEKISHIVLVFQLLNKKLPVGVGNHLQILEVQKQPPRSCSVKKSVLKKFAIFIGKHLSCSPFLTNNTCQRLFLQLTLIYSEVALQKHYNNVLKIQKISRKLYLDDI